MVLAGTIVAALAQTNAPGARKLSLEDCIQSALEKNLDLRIARYNPPMALSDLQNAYAGYDPNFLVGGRHDFRCPAADSTARSAHVPRPRAIPTASTVQFGRTNTGGLNYSSKGNAAETYGSSSDGPFDSSSGSASSALPSRC